MRTTLTVSLPKKLRREIGQSVRALPDRRWEESFEASRRKLTPLDRAQGINTDEDVFKRVS